MIKKIFKYGIMGLIALFVVGAAYVRFYNVATPPIDFATLVLSDSPNQYLICPKDKCKQAKSNKIAPVFAVSASDLRAHWDAVVTAQERISLTQTSGSTGQITYVQRTLLMAYPDIITFDPISLGEGKSTFALYSRSVYGRKDFGVNKERIDAWLALLEKRVKS